MIRILIASIILALGLSYSNFYNFYQWLSYFFICFIVSLVISYFFYLLLNFYSTKSLFRFRLTGLAIKKERKFFDRIRGKPLKRTIRIPISELISLVFIVITNGYFFPILSLNFEEKPIESLKTGIKSEEIFKSLYYSLFTLIFIVFLLNPLFECNWFLKGVYLIILKIVFVFLITYTLPWSFLLSPLFSWVLKFEYDPKFISDNVLLVNKRLYFSYTVFLYSLYALSIFFNTFVALVVSGIIFIYIWYRMFLKEVVEKT